MAKGKNKRVFTKYMAGGHVGAAGTTTEDIGADRWTVQEDIDIIGVEIFAVVPGESLGNDGFCDGLAEISQVGARLADGCIASVMPSAQWNTSPAAVQCHTDHVVVMLPEGHAVPIREEGTVYLNLCMYAALLSAGTPEVNAHAIVYYTK